jgi:hypothetical protein
VVQEVQHHNVVGDEFRAKGGESDDKSRKIPKLKQPIEKVKKNSEQKNEVVKEVQTNQFNHLKNQSEAGKEVHHPQKEADLDSYKESDPLHESHTPSREDFDNLKKHLKRIGTN